MNGQMGGMIVAFRDKACNGARLRFKSLNTGKSYTSRMNMFSRNSIKQLTVMTIPAGQYQLVSAKCQNGNIIYNYKDIAKGYGPITVLPGEVVYPGTLIRYVVVAVFLAITCSMKRAQRLKLLV